MVATMPNVPDSGEYNFTQTAKLLGISRPTLRDRVQRGFIKQHQYRDNGLPFFYGSDIKYYFRRRKI